MLITLNKKAQLETKLKITNHPFSLKINVGKLKLEKTNFNVSRFYSKREKDLLDLTLKGNKIEISEVLAPYLTLNQIFTKIILQREF